MKTKTKALTAFLAVGVLAGVFFFTPSGASQTAEQEAKTAVNKYLKAIESGDVEGMMNSTIDKRFKDETAKRSAYETLSKEKDQKTQVLSLKQVDETHMEVNLRVTTNAAGTQEITLPVVKDSNEWKVVIEKKKVIPKAQ